MAAHEQLIELRSQEAVEESFARLGPDITRNGVILASAGVCLATDESCLPADLDISVDQATYNTLREDPSWHEVTGANGQPLIRQGYYDIGVGWGQTTHEKVQQDSWQTERGTPVASLPLIYAYDQDRGLYRDKLRTAHIRHELQKEREEPLSELVMARELEIVRSILPDHLRNPAVEYLLAENLLTEYTLYGDPRIGRINHMVGEVEHEEYRVPALYHNGFSLVADLQQLVARFASLDASGGRSPFSIEDRQDILIGHLAADAVYAYGRESANPGRHDELRSARRIANRARLLGFSKERANRIFTIVEQTEYDEVTGRQKGQHHQDPAVREVCGQDLIETSRPESEVSTMHICMEDGIAARHSEARIAGRVAVEHDVRITSHADALVFYGEYGDARPSGMRDTPTVAEFLGTRLIKNGNFHDPDHPNGYQAPDGYPVHLEIRRAHAHNIRNMGHSVLVGVDPFDIYERAQENAEKLFKQYPETILLTD